MSEISSSVHEGVVVIERGRNRTCGGTLVDLCMVSGGEAFIPNRMRVQHELLSHPFVPLDHLRVRSRRQGFFRQQVRKEGPISGVDYLEALDGILQERDMLIGLQ